MRVAGTVLEPVLDLMPLGTAAYRLGTFEAARDRFGAVESVKSTL